MSSIKELFNKLLSYIRNYWKYIGIVLFVAYQVTNGYPILSSFGSTSTPDAANTTIVKPLVKEAVNVKLTHKVTPDDPDLEVSTRYKAVINGTEVTIPNTNKVTKGDIGDTKASVETVVDLTPLVEQIVDKEVKHQWGFSTGVGVHDKDLYIPITITRYYKSHKAFSISVHTDPKDGFRPNGFEVSHQWYF